MSVQVTNNDIVFLGHGSYHGGANNFRLPESIDLYVLPPIGYKLMTNVASALIQQTKIEKLTLSHNGGSVGVIDPPIAVYRGGGLAPDLILHDLGSLASWGKNTIGDKKNVVTVNQDTLLSQLIKFNVKIMEALKILPQGEKLKLYWSACANQVSGYTAGL